MYDLCPYFTNDGTVGLFSRSDDDIYHSTYGALTESWQKFINPSGLETYIKQNNEVKILDICYGIGYNTKTALQVFVNNALKNFKYKNKNYKNIKSAIAAIYPDNIFTNKKIKTDFKKHNSISLLDINNEKIYSDNISPSQNIKLIDEEQKITTDDAIICNKILIDAVDIDSVLINLSPYISNGATNVFGLGNQIKNASFDENNIKNIRKIKKSKFSTLPNNYKLNKEVSIILLEKLINENSAIFNDQLFNTIVSEKMLSPFLNEYIVNYSKLYENFRCNSIKNKFKMTFLHNIYYKYLSSSYKKAREILKNNDISIKFYDNDARQFVKHTNNKYNFIFLDAFTPAKCPTLWTVQFFKALYSCLEDDGKILTYSNSAAVRNAMLLNGFYVGKIYNKDLNKFIGTIAAKNNLFIEYQLDEFDFDLMNSKAGICFKDANLDLNNSDILRNREIEVKQSDLISSSKVLKGYKNASAKPL